MSGISFIPPRLERLDDQPPGGLLGMFRFERRNPLVGVASLVDWRLLGHLSKLVIEGFLTGADGESVLVPLGARMPHDHLVIQGLGDPDTLTRRSFEGAIGRLLSCAASLGHRDITLTLPGRPEGAYETSDAVEHFLSVYDRIGKDMPITIIETPGAQKAMLPAVERWRLKNSVPPEPAAGS